MAEHSTGKETRTRVTDVSETVRSAANSNGNAAQVLIVNISELASRIGRSVPTIKHWIRSGMPVVTRGDQGHEWQIDLAAVFRWREETRGKGAANDNAETDDESHKDAIDRERARKLAAEADIAEMDAAQRRGELIPIAIVAKDRAESIARARGVLIAMETKLAPLCAAETDVLIVRSIIGAEIRRALSELARSGLSRGDGGDGPDMDAAA
jgi:phage terminase Nu1 subunit (DNA packaging protein)